MNRSDPSIAPVRVTVCVSTYQRPRGLARLVDAIADLEVPPDVEPALVIVDNEVVEPPQEAPRIDGWTTTRVTEARRGIPFSRNRAVAEAGDTDAIVFFDDDEVPRPDALVRLVAVWRETGADVVQGASVPVFETEPPSWIERTGYFVRSFDHDGVEIPSFRARTSNVLVAARVFGVADPPFDEGLVLSGGSDSYLFRTAEAAGYRFVAAPSSVVEEHIPASRTDPRWLIERQYRTGWGRSYHLRRNGPGVVRVAKRVAAGLLAMAGAVPAALLGGPGLAARLTAGGRKAAYGLGLIAGLVVAPPAPYAEVDGS